MHFKNLNLSDWQQFKNIDIEFHEKVTILTGANGSGKTTILGLLARHFGWNQTLLATPYKSKENGIIKFFARFWNGEPMQNDKLIGKLTYDNGQIAKLTIPDSNSAQYNLNIDQQQSVECFYIPSHRAIYRYQPVQNIPITKKNKDNAFQEVSESIKQRYFSDHSTSSSFYMKNTLIGWAIQGYGVRSDTKTIMPSDDDQLSCFVGFQDVLRKVLPSSLGFEEIEIRGMEVVFVCNSGKDVFLLETASGGISTIIDMAWQIFMYWKKERNDFTVIVDEIENHLHPTMQRQILTDFSNAFPNVRFIVSTHSPLIVSSVKDSYVYVLSYDNNKIVSQKLDFKNQPKTASEILDEVLGVSFTMPIWVENELKILTDKFYKTNMTQEDFKQLRNELVRLGLERLMPAAIRNIVNRGEE